jgi:hypothetical protein
LEGEDARRWQKEEVIFSGAMMRSGLGAGGLGAVQCVSELNQAQADPICERTPVEMIEIGLVPESKLPVRGSQGEFAGNVH